jgi:hypothetical protein
MPKPKLIEKPKRVTVYLPQEIADHGRSIAGRSGLSLSQLISDLLRSQASTLARVRVHADFSGEEFEVLRQVADNEGMSVEDLVRSATYSLLDSRPG